MTDARNNERLVNALLARALDRRHPRWQVDAEQSQTLISSAAKQPDVVIRPSGAGLLPLVIETEHSPARTVESDADARLGETLTTTNTNIERAVALKLPDALATAAQHTLGTLVEDPGTEFAWCLRSREDNEVRRWPSTGWVTGNVNDLARFCELKLIDDDGLAKAAQQMEVTVAALAQHLFSNDDDRTKLANAAAVVMQEHNEQTAMMVMTLLANAFLFERAVEGTADRNGNVLPITASTDSKTTLLANWSTILAFNYWPIFHIAREIVDQGIRSVTAAVSVVPQLVTLADDLSRYGVTATGDIAGQMFGKLITDRKYLATFYTLPSAAYLIAELAADKLDNAKQMPSGIGEHLESFRVADLACGTGALLTAFYQRVAARIRSTGNDDAATHQTFMEQVICAADVMPAAAHLTATLLASTHPSTTFTDTNIALYPIGQDPAAARQGEAPSPENVRLGSLELLDANEIHGNLLRRSTQLQKAAVTGTGEVVQPISIGERTLDVCVMNPPFTSNSSRPTDNVAGLQNRKWAGLGRTEAEQAAMEARELRLVAARRKRLASSLATGVEPAHHGNVGLAASFIDLADSKLKHGGVLGLILPQSFLSGSRWVNARKLIEALYEDVVVVTIAAAGQQDRAFSAGTGMAECMLVARKTMSGASSKPGVLYVSLYERPASTVDAVEIAKAAAAAASLTDTTKATTGVIRVGTQHACGSYAFADQLSGRFAGVRDVRLINTAQQVAGGSLDLSTMAAISLPITALGDVADVSPNHVMIGTTDGSISSSEEGPLIIHNKTDDRTAWKTFNYRTLWWHDHKAETNLEVTPDAEGAARPGRKTEADTLWNTWATRLHMNLEFGLASQPLAACLTRKPTLGGRAWPTVKLQDEVWECAAVLWHNSTLGLVLWWLHGSRQQGGRANLTVTRLPDMPTLDYRQLTDEQLAKADEIYERFTTGDTKLTLRPANEVWHDQARHELDRAVLEDVLGLNWENISSPLATLREQWCCEPSVHGGQMTRPDSVGGNVTLVLARERLNGYADRMRSPERQTRWRKLVKRRTDTTLPAKHYLATFDDLASMSAANADIVSDIAVIVRHDLNVARNGVEQSEADEDAATDDAARAAARTRAKRWQRSVAALEGVQREIDDLRS